jgi:hypothetical protein
VLRQILRIKRGRIDSTAVFAVTLLRSVSITLTATEHVGMHLGLGLRLLWMELSVGFALWEVPLDTVE